jgi:hypothetical protein
MINYRTTYNRFVSSAKKKMVESNLNSLPKIYRFQRKDKLEVHHIVPKILGGSKNDPNNLVLLTHDEHIYAHFLLNLALFQEGHHEKLVQLGYSGFPEKMLEMLNTRKNVLRGLKIKMFINGKKYDPTIMSIREVVKFFCMLARKSFTNQIFFNDIFIKVMRAALFSKSMYGFKLKLSM